MHVITSADIHPHIPQGWRRNVKARLFVMTLRDNFSDVPTRTSSAVAAALGRDPAAMQLTDEWAFEYISINYLQSIMEAFDDDGSGYITVGEVNRFVDALPSEVKWRYTSLYLTDRMRY